MSADLHLPILPQPDDVTCGPTCLQAVYSFYDDHVAVPELIREVEPLEGRGTVAVLLAHHALRRGYRATLYTYNLEVFDPTWFAPGIGDPQRLRAFLARQAWLKPSPRLRFVTDAYLRFLELGGDLRYRELNAALLVDLLKRGPVLTGLSATYLYGCAREVDDGERLHYDDLRGVATGHFVVLYGFHAETREVLVADPLRGNPFSGEDHHYAVGIDRLLGAIMLGVLTYDGNLLLLEPSSRRSGASPAEDGATT